MTREERIRLALSIATDTKEFVMGSGAPADPADIGLSRERLKALFPLVQMMRYRYTLLDLAKQGCFYDKIVDPLFAKG